MATSLATSLRRAIVAIADADATMRTLCGRPTRLMVAWSTLADAQYPVLAYQAPSNVQTGGLGDRRRVLVTCAAFADGDTAQTTVEALVQRLREILTPAAFLAQGVTAWVDRLDERDGGSDEPDGASTRARMDLDVLLVATAPT